MSFYPSRKEILFFKILFSIFTIVLVVLILLPKSASSDTAAALWKFQSIDTMKYSRDAASDKSVLLQVPTIVKNVADLKATHIAIATPYDEQFYPVLKAWVAEARKNNLKVWFRGNFSSWEGWFNYPQMTDITQHHKMTMQFITSHPDLFQSGDIFTPVPEPENGAIGDPRRSPQDAQRYNQFLIDSYQNCQKSFEKIHKNVTCGYFSMNGDIAKDVLTKDTVEKIGNVIVIDHYVDSPEKMASEIDLLYKKFNAHIILGEFGAPIPDINGDMTESEQASFIDKILQVLYLRHTIVDGLNYWVILGGSTSLYNDDGTPRQATQVIKHYFSPNMLKANVMNSIGDPVSNAHVRIDTVEQSLTNSDGNATVVTPFDSLTIQTSAKGYIDQAQTVFFGTNKTVSITVTLTPVNPDAIYKFRLYIKNLLHLP